MSSEASKCVVDSLACELRKRPQDFSLVSGTGIVDLDGDGGSSIICRDLNGGYYHIIACSINIQWKKLVPPLGHFLVPPPC
jgi:hypothetical protein